MNFRIIALNVYLIFFISFHAYTQQLDSRCQNTIEEISQVIVAQKGELPSPKLASVNTDTVRERAFQVLIAYDGVIPNQILQPDSTVRSLIMSAAQKVPEGIENAQGENPGFEFTIIDFNADYLEFATIPQIRTWTLIPTDGKLDELTDLKKKLDYDLFIFISRANTFGAGNGSATQMVLNPLQFYSEYATAAIKWESIEDGSVRLAHEIGHLLGMDHEEGKAGNKSPEYARAFIGPNSASICVSEEMPGLQDIPIYSSPNSIIAMDTLGSMDACNLCAYDSIKTLYFLENPRTYLDFIGGNECGKGTLYAETNADSLEWTILSGEVTLDTTMGNEVSYICTTEATLLFRGTKTDKLYSVYDTVFLFPDIITEIQDTLLIGESYVLPDSTIVTEAGEYSTVLQSQIGCDSTVLTTLHFVSSVTESLVNDIGIFPNPTNGVFFIETNADLLSINAYNIFGEKILIRKLAANSFEFQDFVGTAIVQIVDKDKTSSFHKVLVQ